eukprot:Skav224878  [mRNA]  locus=scaffold1112:147858:153044:+ [translate_table: standard]
MMTPTIGPALCRLCISWLGTLEKAFSKWYGSSWAGPRWPVDFCNAEDNDNQRPALITRLEELPEDTAQEVGWYLQDACLFQVSPPVSDDEDDFDNTAPYEFVEGTFERKRKGAPQNMKEGLGGPAKDWLPPKEHAIGHPEWFQGGGQLSSSPSISQPSRLLSNGVSHLDTILDKARKRREEFKASSANKLVSMKAADFCTAIEKDDVMKAFAKLDDKTASCPHPETGRCAAHYCIATGLGSEERGQRAHNCTNLHSKAGRPLASALLAQSGDQEAAQVLLDAGADAAATDSLGRAASDMVKARGGAMLKAEDIKIKKRRSLSLSPLSTTRNGTPWKERCRKTKKKKTAREYAKPMQL